MHPQGVGESSWIGHHVHPVLAVCQLLGRMGLLPPLLLGAPPLLLLAAP